MEISMDYSASTYVSGTLNNPTWPSDEISRRVYADACAAAGRGDHVVVEGGRLHLVRYRRRLGWVGRSYRPAAGDAVDGVAGDVLGDELPRDVAVLDFVVRIWW